MVTAALAEDDSGLIFNNDEIMVKPNEKVNLECGLTGSYRYCIWEHRGEQIDTFDVHDNIYPGIMSKPENITDNQCGIILESASTEDHGEWTCKVFIKGETLIGRKNITILVKPTQVELTPVELISTADKHTNITCTVMKARPAGQITWLLADVDITEHAQVEDTPVTSDGIYLTVSTLKRTFTAIDNKKDLKCVVDHPALDKSAIIISRSLNVLYAPIKIMPTIIFINESNFLEIRVNFSANPKPSNISWQYGKTFENLTDEVEIPFDSDMIMTKLETWDFEHYTAVINISSFDEKDFQIQYNLFVENEIGSTNYEVMVEPLVENQEYDDETVIIAVVLITSTLVLTIAAALICIWRNCRQNKDLIIANLPSCQKCYSSSKEDKPDEETGVHKLDGERPIINNVVVEDEITGDEKKDGIKEVDNFVDNIMKDVLDKVKNSEEFRNVKNTDV